MKLEIVFNTQYKGYKPKSPVIFDAPIIVLTGRNGSGKSRLLEGLQKSVYKATLNNEELKQADIRVVPHTALTPRSGGDYDDSVHENKIRAILKDYDGMKHSPLLLHAGLGAANAPAHPSLPARPGVMVQAGVAIDRVALSKNIMKISRQMKKPPNQLTHEDIKLNFEEPVSNVIGINDLSNTFNRYIKRLHQNKFNKFRSSEGESIKYYSGEEFEALFGKRPWILLNEIIGDVFDEKFYF